MRLIAIFLILLSFNTVIGQDKSKLFSAQEFVWCGLDFSKVKCIGAEGFTDPEKIKETYFGAWNDLIINESDKYDLKETFQKSEQINNLTVAERRNEMPDYEALVQQEPYSFQEGELEKIVADYNFENINEGIGLVYVFEALNKTEEVAVFHVVFFDLSDGSIIWEQKHNAKPGGFGFRNYWAGAVYRSLAESEYNYKKELKAYYKAQKKKNK